MQRCMQYDDLIGNADAWLDKIYPSAGPSTVPKHVISRVWPLQFLAEMI